MRWLLVLVLAAAPTQSGEAARRARDPDPGVRCRAVEALRREETEEAACELRALLDDAHPRVRLRAAAALSRMKNARTALIEGLDAAQARIRAACAGLLPGEEAVRPLLREPVASVRAAAVRALGEETPRGFEREAPRVKIAILDTLGFREEALTDRDYRVRIAAVESNPDRRLPNDPDWRVRRAAEGSTRVISEQVIYLLDYSASMLDRVEDLRDEAAGTIRKLSSDAALNVVLIGTEPRPWRKRLQKATRSARANAIRFLQRQGTRGFTNLYDSIELAFRDPAVREIVLLSDGGVSRGTFIAWKEILQQVRAMNRFRRIRIHTLQWIHAGSRPWHRELMRGLATGSGGGYRAIRPP